MLRLVIRRSVSRIGGTTADSIGTGNKRIRLSVSSLRTSLRAFKRAIIGPSALASGYWTTTTSWAPNSAEQCFRVPLEQSAAAGHRSEEHTSELQSLMRRSYAVFCLQKKKK